MSVTHLALVIVVLSKQVDGVGFDIDILRTFNPLPMGTRCFAFAAEYGDRCKVLRRADVGHKPVQDHLRADERAPQICGPTCL